MKPLISVIIPVYNGQDYIENCIESVCNQTYDNLEIVIINDGSTDSTAIVCEEVIAKRAIKTIAKNRNIIIVNQNNKGVSASRNIGIRKSSGEYISFVDVDDRIAPRMIQVLYDNMLASRCDVSGCGFFRWSTEKEWEAIIGRNIIKDKSFKTYSSEQFIKQIVNGNTRCWSKLYKKKCFLDFNISFFENLTIGEDMLILVELAKENIIFCETEYQGYGYYQNSTSVMNKKFSIKSMDQIYCWEQARRIIGESAQIDSIIVMTSIISMGRIALLNDIERRNYTSEIKIIYDTLKKYNNKEVRKLLNIGYKLKSMVCMLNPRLYLFMYGAWKRMQGK